jgi:hypothetical protein
MMPNPSFERESPEAAAPQFYKAGRVMPAILQIMKIDITSLQRADKQR